MMASNETSEGKSGRGRGARGAAKQDQAEPEVTELVTTPSGLKVMAAFRIPKRLHGAMQQEAQAEALDLTAYVNRLFDGFLHYFALPSVVRENLEDDREKLGFTRYEYFQYVLYRRHEAVSQQGPGFDRSKRK